MEITEKTKWPHRQAAVVSDAPNFHMHIRDIVRALSWRIDAPPYVVTQIKQMLKSGDFYFYIVDDSPTLSAYESVQCIVSDPIGRLTPILTMLSEESIRDKKALKNILGVGLATRPLTPSVFLPAMETLLRQWEQPAFMALRKCAEGLKNGHTSDVVSILIKLSQTPQVASYALHALLTLLKRQNELKEAENHMLKTLKIGLNDPAVLATCARFYLDSLMPSQALRFLNKITQIFAGSTILAFDIAEAHIALGDLKSAIDVLLAWNIQHPGNESVHTFLSRLFIAEGRDDQLERLLLMNKSAKNRLLESWEHAESPMSRASA